MHPGASLIYAFMKKLIVPSVVVYSVASLSANPKVQTIIDVVEEEKVAKPTEVEVLKPDEKMVLEKEVEVVEAHEGVKISFTFDAYGSWDGVGPFGQSVIMFEAGGLQLLNTTFNNCYRVCTGNMWQSYPEPYHPQ